MARIGEELDGCAVLFSHLGSPRRYPRPPRLDAAGKLLPAGVTARLVLVPIEVKQVPRLDGPGEVHRLAFSPDGRRLAVGYYSGHPVVVFDT